MTAVRVLPGLALLILAVALLLQWRDWPPPPSTAGLDPAPSGDASAQGASDPDPLARLQPLEPKDKYVSVNERPIFRPDRKPPDPADTASESPAASEGATTLEGMDLSAVVITPEVVSAWIRDPKQPDLRRLRIGDELEGWAVQDIQPDRVLLERQGEQDALILRDYSNAAPASAPPPAPMPIPRRPPPVTDPGDDADH